MTSWQTKLAIAVLAISCSAARAQSLGDVARLERDRRAKMAHHAPMLTDEDLRRDQILQKPPQSDSALPSPDNSTSLDENLPLGDYARALRQRRLAEPLPPENAVATGPAPEQLPSTLVLATPESQSDALQASTTMSLGDLARQVRAQRAAARSARIRQRKAAQLNAALPAAHPRKNPVGTAKAKAAPLTAHKEQSSTPSPKLAHSTEAHSKATASQSAATQPASAAANEQSIHVSRGSSLWKIARTYLGAGHLWPTLWKANPQIQDPNHIRAGQTLRFPAVDDQNNPVQVAGLKQPARSAGSTGVPVSWRNSPRQQAQLASVSAIQARAHLRKSLFYRPLSR